MQVGSMRSSPWWYSAATPVLVVAVLGLFAAACGPGADTVPPQLSLQGTSSGDVFDIDLVTVRVRVFDDSDVVNVMFWTDRGAAGPCTPLADGDHACSGIPLVAGVNTVTVRAEDAAGNAAELSLLLLRRVADGTPPTLELQELDPGATGARDEITVLALVEDESGVASVAFATDHGATGACGEVAAGTYVCGPIALPEGDTTITVTATDVVGNGASASITVTRDETPPEVAFSGLSDGDVVSEERIVATVVATDDGAVATVSFATDHGATGACGEVAGDTYACGPIPLPLGDTTITVTAEDTAGNAAQKALIVRRQSVEPHPDVLPPTLRLLDVVDGQIVTASELTLTAEASDDRGVASVAYATNHGASANCTFLLGGRYRCGPAPLTLGDTEFVVTARDAAGNQTSVAVTVTRVEAADETPPEVAFSGLSDGDVVSEERIVATVVATDDGAVATVSFGTDHGATGACGAVAGDTYACGPLPLPEGDTTITVTATDLAGNSGSASVTVRREVAPPSPGFDIEIVFFDETFSAGQRAAFATAVDRWESIVVGDLEDVTVTLSSNGSCGVGEPALSGTIDDLVIFATSFTEGIGGLLGSAGPCLYRASGADAGTNLVGLMRFDTLDLANLESSGYLVDVIVHEMAHVLGFGTNWEFPPYFDLLDYLPSAPATGCRTASGFARDPTYIGGNGIAAYDDLGGSGAVPVEETGGPGTQCGHWDEEAFDDELMTGYLSLGGSNALSALSARSLQDLGLTVDASQADPYELPDFPALRTEGGLDLGAAEHLLRPRGGIDPTTGTIDGQADTAP